MLRAVASAASAAFHFVFDGGDDAGLEPKIKFFKAVGEGDVAKVERLLLANGADPNAMVDFEWTKPDEHIPAYTAMHLAPIAEKNALPVLTLMLDNGGDPNVLDEEGCTPLLAAINTPEGPQMACVRLLLDRGAKADVVSNETGIHRTPLMAAVTAKNAELVRLLLQHGADPNGVSPPGVRHDPFFMPILAASGDADGVTALCMSAQSYDPQTPESSDRVNVLRLLLARGANPNGVPNPKFGTPLMTAAIYGDPTATAALLAAGADPNGRSLNNETALTSAAMSGNLETVRMLVEHGADVRHASKSASGVERVTALHGACEMGHVDIVKLLLATKRVDVDAVTNPPFTPLTLAIQLERVDCAIALLDAGANVNLLGPIYFAIAHGEVSVVEALLERQCDLDRFDQEGHTPLTLAISKRNVAMVKLLLEKGKVDPNKKKQDGMPPLELAQLEGFAEIVDLLKASGAVEVEP
ncbi:ankyrin repeat-containing domain protein [Zopfochytrium polystomum]|nr:ankyrin repeat-containing domain protein [Zopfochytrium polystomum]